MTLWQRIRAWFTTPTTGRCWRCGGTGVDLEDHGFSTTEIPCEVCDGTGRLAQPQLEG